MASLRTAQPSVSSIFRFTTQPASSTRRCAQCLKSQRCPFSSFRPRLQSSKRPLMTESAAYRPQSLDPNLMPPPRNAGVPETSIAGEQTGFGSTIWPPKSPWARQDGESEKEAQKSRPAPSPVLQEATPVPAPATAPPKKKSKLRARKAPINLTPTAVVQLRQLFDQPTSQLIRVGVKNRGCSGLAYHLEYVDKPGAFDESVEQDGVKVLIDSKALFSIIGSEMDWVEDKLSARFVFRNPNITEQCGCGESFSIS
nr:hypothetical protein B0A51_03724 [Rachicladosporium sp. CCFEE 5018]